MVPRCYLICVVLMLLSCQVLAKTTRCPNQVQCLVNPCKGATCKNYPKAKCRPNYCGGCNKEFYVKRKRVTCG